MTGNSTHSDLQKNIFSTAENALWLTAYLVVILPNLVGNSLVCIIINKEKSLHTFTYFLLANLSVADLLTGLFASSEALLFTFLERYSRGPFLCRVIQGGLVTKFAAMVSVFTLTLVSIERYYSIVKPLKRVSILRKNKLKFIIPALWFVSLLCIFPVNYERYIVMEDKKGCYLKDREEGQGFLVFFIQSIAILIYILTMGIMMFSFYNIWKVLWGQNIDSTMEGTRQGTLQARRKVVRILASVIIAFNVCLLPYLLAGGQLFFRGYIRGFRIVYLLAALNSSINPVIYFFQSPQFKRSFKSGVLCLKSNQVDNFAIDDTSQIETEKGIRGNVQRITVATLNQQTERTNPETNTLIHAQVHDFSCNTKK